MTYALKDLNDDTYVSAVNVGKNDCEAWTGEMGDAHQFATIPEALRFLQTFVFNHSPIGGRLTIVKLVRGGYTEVAL